MTQRCCIAVLVACLCLAGCDEKPTNKVYPKPSEGHVDAEAKAGFVGQVPFAYVSLQIKGLDIIAAKVLDWISGTIEYMLGGKTVQMKLTEAQLNAVKNGEQATGTLQDGTEFTVLARKKTTTKIGHLDAKRRTPATISIKVDPDAKVYLDGTLTKATGAERKFTTPDLEQGTFRYTFVVTWIEDGKERRVERVVRFRAGDITRVDLTTD